MGQAPESCHHSRGGTRVVATAEGEVRAGYGALGPLELGTDGVSFWLSGASSIHPTKGTHSCVPKISTRFF